jgi:hypothetical protein
MPMRNRAASPSARIESMKLYCAGREVFWGEERFPRDLQPAFHIAMTTSQDEIRRAPPEMCCLLSAQS